MQAWDTYSTPLIHMAFHHLLFRNVCSVYISWGYVFVSYHSHLIFVLLVSSFESCLHYMLSVICSHSRRWHSRAWAWRRESRWENQSYALSLSFPLVVLCTIVISENSFISTESQHDKRVARDDEFSDSEDEGDDRRDESLSGPSNRKRLRLITKDMGEKEKESILKPRISNSFSPSPAPSGSSAIGISKEDEQRKGSNEHGGIGAGKRLK